MIQKRERPLGRHSIGLIGTVGQHTAYAADTEPLLNAPGGSGAVIEDVCSGATVFQEQCGNCLYWI